MENKSAIAVVILALLALLVAGAAVMKMSHGNTPESTKQLTQEQRLNTLDKLPARSPNVRYVVENQDEATKALNEVQNEGR